MNTRFSALSTLLFTLSLLAGGCQEAMELGDDDGGAGADSAGGSYDLDAFPGGTDGTDGEDSDGQDSDGQDSDGGPDGFDPEIRFEFDDTGGGGGPEDVPGDTDPTGGEPLDGFGCVIEGAIVGYCDDELSLVLDCDADFEQTCHDGGGEVVPVPAQRGVMVCDDNNDVVAECTPDWINGCAEIGEFECINSSDDGSCTEGQCWCDGFLCGG